jgi:hypothetical protein
MWIHLVICTVYNMWNVFEWCFSLYHCSVMVYENKDIVCLSCLVFFNWYFVWKLQLPIGKGGISQNIRFLLQTTGYLVGNLQFPITYGSLWIQFPPRISYDMLWTKREQYLIFSSHLIIVRTFVSLFCTTYRCVCLALKIIFFQMKQ